MTAVATRLEAPAEAQSVNPREPQRRVSNLLDAGTLIPLRPRDSSGAFTARGRIDGAKVVVYCTDATKMGGAMSAEGCRHIVEAIDTAVRERCPVIGLWHSGGARLAEGVEALDGVGQVFAAMVRASGRVPQISVVLGPAAGGAAYGPALTDIVIMAADGRVFVTGPDVVRSVTGEKVDMEELGGPSAHGRKSGVVHVVADDEADAMVRARRITGLFARPGMTDLSSAREERDLRALLPDQPQRAYDVRPLVRAILDQSDEGSGQTGERAEFEELQPKYAPNIVIGLGRLGGRTVGVVANNPLRLAGCLDSASAEKSARFVRMCDSFGIPLLVIVDVPGYLPGVGQEWDGVVRRGAKLLHAFAEAIVPRVTLVTRKAYGGAYIAMNSRSLGATYVFAWPEAEVAVMGAKAAVGILHRRALAAADEAERDALHTRLAEEHEQIAGGVNRALSLGVVDEVIEPRHTRRRLVEAFAAAHAGRGAHGNIPL
jgi:acetyl-CoA/propionyl-CoA carboxylase carboxyl transferase subunit